MGRFNIARSKNIPRMRPLVVAALPIYTDRDLEKIVNINSDLVELRLDYSSNLPDVELLTKYKDKIIVTIRDPREGGVNRIDEGRKAEYLRVLYEKDILFDVEAAFVERYDIPYKNKIVSVHYFNELPDFKEVDKVVSKYEDEAYTVKIAVMAKGSYKKLLADILFSHKNVTVLPMGSDPLERIAFGILGSKLIYTYVDKPTAPGQMKYTRAMKILDELFLDN